MRSSKVIESLKEGDLLLEVVSFFAKTQGLSGQWCQGLADGEIESLQKSSTDLKPKFHQSVCSALYPMSDAGYSALFSLLDNLTIDQIRIWLFDWVLWTTTLSCSGKSYHFMIAFGKLCSVKMHCFSKLYLSEARLRVRVAKAKTEVEDLNSQGQGKRRFDSTQSLKEAAEAIMKRYDVQGCLQLSFEEIVINRRKVRRYKDRPERR
jgi:hypothetical protein